MKTKSLHTYHIHMGGPDADALEWVALQSPRFSARLEHMGVTLVSDPSQADVAVVTGLLTPQNLGAVLSELARLPSPCLIIAAGDSAIDYGIWAKVHDTEPEPGSELAKDEQLSVDSELSTSTRKHRSRHSPRPLSYYVDIHINVPGDPPTPQALIAALGTAAEMLSSLTERTTPSDFGF